MPHDAGELPSLPESWLLVDIYDSDMAAVVYRPTGSGSGDRHLGVTLRIYFEDPDASAPTDVAREAGGLYDVTPFGVRRTPLRLGTS